ncbi:enoyl-CoA hydratase/isomerase family protein [Desulfosporosinus youngiae]|uniref:short-chain-enoyl-CoA hydratase n=1 Tax=Desulfosporosinus youngiae DSM 17734 TaxID=768710 RepID=H5XUX3_9FIRM|nr:enoyl-CoA hydratase-related protein [Desulfosporosinus youngiae]EHQ89425.1 enoyl-CoA hydratase/carnithine racemase [Desulfosporosinus youngiae DSM 17734]
MREFKNLIYQNEDNIGIITLNRPKVLNATNSELLKELAELLDEISGDDKVRALILTGGEKVFVAGGDIQFMSQAAPLEMEKFIALGHKVYDRIANFNKPVIAAIFGMALGGGCELALACDIRIAADNAKFGQPEINLGIIPGAGGTQRLSRVVGPGWANYLIMTGRIIKADLALKIGLVTEILPAGQLMTRARELALELAAKSPVAMRLAKSCINNGANSSLSSGLLYEQKVWALLFATEDQKEGMNAFLEKRKPEFKGK